MIMFLLVVVGKKVRFSYGSVGAAIVAWLAKGGFLSAIPQSFLASPRKHFVLPHWCNHLHQVMVDEDLSYNHEEKRELTCPSAISLPTWDSLSPFGR